MSEKPLKRKKKAAQAGPLFGAPIEEAAALSDPEHGAVPLPIKAAVLFLNERGAKDNGAPRSRFPQQL